MNPTNGWRPTPAHARAVLGSLILAAAAVLARRPDLIVIAAPLVGVSIWSVALRPSSVPEIDQRLGNTTVREGDTITWSIGASDPGGRTEAVAARFGTPPLIDQAPTGGWLLAGPDVGSDRVEVRIRPTRWGTYRLNPVVVVGSSGWNAFRFVVSDPLPDRSRLTVLPEPSRFDPVSAGVAKRGLVGDNRSPRPGSGSEFASIRPFQPGDRLRRIHWPVSLRTGELHVTST